MIKILRSSFYKLFKDWTFRITLIIGAVLAVGMNLLYLTIDHLAADSSMVCNGQSALINSLSPLQNFGLTVPINLIIFTIGEFNFGTIRNKIIAGNKKSSIYIGLFLTGIVFTLCLMTAYVGISFGIGCIFGGFDPNGMTLYGFVTGDFIWKYLVQAICVYIFLTAFTIFVSTLLRNIGPAMPIVIVSIMILFFWPMIASIGDEVSAAMTAAETGTPVVIPENWSQWIDPLYIFGTRMIQTRAIPTETLIASIATSLGWSALFTVLGTVIFSKRDVK